MEHLDPPSKWDSIVVTGPHARQLASQLLARLNRKGASQGQLTEAVDLLQRRGGPDGYIAWAVESRDVRRRTGEVFHNDDLGAMGLNDVERLALEMAVNEEVERHAVQGELEALRAAWRDAEEVARIADDLLVPDLVRKALRGLRGSKLTS